MLCPWTLQDTPRSLRSLRRHIYHLSTPMFVPSYEKSEVRNQCKEKVCLDFTKLWANWPICFIYRHKYTYLHIRLWNITLFPCQISRRDPCRTLMDTQNRHRYHITNKDCLQTSSHWRAKVDSWYRWLTSTWMAWTTLQLQTISHLQIQRKDLFPSYIFISLLCKEDFDRLGVFFWINSKVLE